MLRRVAALLAVPALAVACGEPEPSVEPPATPAPAATSEPDLSGAQGQLPEVLWHTGFSPDFDWARDAGVVAASRTNVAIADRGPDGRADVLELSFGEDGSRWGIDLRHDLSLLGVEPPEELHLSYDVYFPVDFEFRGDGKMAGLAGVGDGLEPLQTSSGGDYDERSFSVRPVWQADRGLIMYLYARSAVARDIENPHHGGYGIPARFAKPDGSEAGVLTPGTWHRIEQRVKLNAPGQTDGVYELWVDGHKGLSVEDIQYRTEAHPDVAINQLFNSWFFGGGADEYPTRENVAYSDRWALTSGYLGAGIDLLDDTGSRG